MTNRISGKSITKNKRLILRLNTITTQLFMPFMTFWSIVPEFVFMHRGIWVSA